MHRRIATLAFGALVAFLGAVAPVSAQYFGRNKVQYEDFDFRILETPHFTVYYYPAEHDAVVQAGRLAERWYARLSHTLDHQFRERQIIVFYSSHADFSQTNVIPGFLSDGIGGVTEGLKGRIVLPFAAGLGETDHVLGHELVHAFQRDILRQRGRSLAMLPLWFVEGMAEYLSVGGIDANTSMWLRDAVDQDRLPPINDLDHPRWFPYRYGQALWAYLAKQYGEDVAARALTSKASGGAVGRVTAATGVDVQMLSAGWHEWIRRSWGVDASADGANDSTPIISDREGGGGLNVGPSLSPDGRDLVFLSERDQYSIDVFLANAATGAITRRIVRTAGDPHFDSLQFIESAGAWHPAGRQFVLAALSRGQPVLTVLDMQTGDIEREIPLGQLDQIFSPTWSPDGRRIAFSALAGGTSDLYMIDIETSALRRLTSDAFADLQPSWSPDGTAIVFATDRFSSSLEHLSFGNYRLATLDVLSGAIGELAAVPDAKNIDPHWSPDGTSVYFIADAGGVSNVYRVVPATGELFQVTDVRTGVSGVTALSPAVSVAARAERLAFSVYRNGAYEIRTIDASRGKPFRAASTRRRDDLSLASASVAGGGSLGLLGQEFTVKPSRDRLSLNGIGQPYLSAGGGSFGGFLRAGVSFAFGDTLGNQHLQTALQVGRGVDDFAAQAVYLNLRSRWNWGLGGGQVPWLVGGSNTFMPEKGSDNTNITRELVVLRQVHRQLAALAVYPFSRATRLEMSAGAHDISFDRRTTTQVYSPTTGRLLEKRMDARVAAVPARLVETGVAMVHDTAVLGPTSPVLGERYRFEIEPTLGNLTFATVTGDYRKYVMPVRPFTVAMRVQHIGRYGAGSGDPRLLPIVSTLRDVVRGYGDTLVLTRSCGDTTDCRPLTHLSARRVVVGNIELRFPPLGAFAGRARYGPLPIETFIFSDAAAFWVRAPLAEAPATRAPLRSVGAGARLNAGGFFFEFDLVRPFDRPSTGWRFAFNVRPGF